MTPSLSEDAGETDGAALVGEPEFTDIAIRGWSDVDRSVPGHGSNVEIELGYCEGYAGSADLTDVVMLEAIEGENCDVDDLVARCVLDSDGTARIRLVAGARRTPTDGEVCLLAYSGARPDVIPKLDPYTGALESVGTEEGPHGATLVIVAADFAGRTLAWTSLLHLGETCGRSFDDPCVVAPLPVGAAICGTDTVDCSAMVRDVPIRLELFEGDGKPLNFDVTATAALTRLEGAGEAAVQPVCGIDGVGSSPASTIQKGSLTSSMPATICASGHGGMFQLDVALTYAPDGLTQRSLYIRFEEQPTSVVAVDLGAVGDGTNVHRVRVDVSGCATGLQGLKLVLEGEPPIVKSGCEDPGTDRFGQCHARLPVVSDEPSLLEVELGATQTQCLFLVED